MKKNLFLLIGLLIFISCSESEKPQNVVVDNRYSMEIPSFLVKATDLNKEASLQYQNIYLEFYVVVIDEPKKEFYDALVENGISEKYSSDLKGYSELITSDFLANITVSSKSELADFKLNGLNARKMTVEGAFNGVDVSFIYILIEGKDKLYQLMTWTLKSKKEEHAVEMDKLINSFKEL